MTFVKWLGKGIDLDHLSISNALMVLTRMVPCLVVIWDGYVSIKGLMRIVGLIGWRWSLAKGPLPLPGGVYSAMFGNRSEWLKVTPRLRISLVTASFVAFALFSTCDVCYCLNWMWCLLILL